MGQYFQVVNLDNPFPLPLGMLGKFGECFWEMDCDCDTELMNALWKPQIGHKRVTVKPLNKLKRFVCQKPCHANATLATELVTVILEQIEDLTDFVCVLVTCQRFYEIGRRQLEARLEEGFVYSWAGNRLICLGDYAEDLPQGMLTDEEIEILEEDADEFDVDSDDNDCDPIIYAQLLHLRTFQPDWDLNQMKARFRKDHPVFKYYWISLNDTNRYWKFPRVNWYDAMVPKYLTSLEEGPDRDKVYDGSIVLRDLTAKEYVRGDAIGDLWDTPDMPYLKALRFVHVLVLRITWTSDSGMSLAYEGPLEIHRGAWAGHRFDACDVSNVQHKEGAIDAWKDVSKEVLGELMAVFEPEAGHLNDWFDGRYLEI